MSQVPLIVLACGCGVPRRAQPWQPGRSELWRSCSALGAGSARMESSGQSRLDYYVSYVHCYSVGYPAVFLHAYFLFKVVLLLYSVPTNLSLFLC